MNTYLKKLFPHLGIILGFLLLSILYFLPATEGKVIQQGDIIHAEGVAHYTQEYFKKHGIRACWAPQLFGGMPAYQVSGAKKNNFVYSTIHNIIRSINSKNISILFLYFLGFYLLLLSFKTNKYLAAAGALAYGLSSYNIIIIAAGHITKAFALGYMPIAVAGFHLIYRKKYPEGIILALLGLGPMIHVGHIQIVYYTALLLGIYVIIDFIFSIKEKKLKQFAIASAISAVVVILAILPNMVGLWQAYEMSKYSIRGPSELSADNNNKGLDKDYALSWSYGIGETFTIIIPNFKGGASGIIGNDPKILNKVSMQYKEIISQQNHYWGNQPFTSGPVYFGALITAIFIFSLFIIKDKKIKWWLILATVFSIILSWGKNFPLLTDFMFYHFPFYNKFRTVSMILVIAGLTVPLGAILGINEILNNPEKSKNYLIKFEIIFGIIGAFLLLIWIGAGFFNYITAQESQYFNSLRQNPQVSQQIDEFLINLKNARKAIFTADVMRSLFYVILAGVLIVLSLIGKIKDKIIIAGILSIFILADLWVIDRRYLSDKNFLPQRKMKNLFTPSFANKFIMKDNDPDFRVVNITTNPFTDAITSYFHFNIGGYHGAKMRRYQDIIEKYLAREVEFLQKAFSDTSVNMNEALAQLQIMNMLNTKYIIYNPQVIPYVNMYAFGHAWFVNNIKFVKNPNEEIQALSTVNLSRSAVVDKSKFTSYKFPALNISAAMDTAFINLTYFSPDTLRYEYYSPEEAFVVFSEIYYPKGWHAYIDKKETKLVRANYILRAMTVPAGKHNITMIFRPAACYKAGTIALISSFVVLMVLLGSIYLLFKNFNIKPQENET